jgi:hypothetical protein
MSKPQSTVARTSKTIRCVPGRNHNNKARSAKSGPITAKNLGMPMGPPQGRGYGGSRPEKEAPNNPLVYSSISFVCLDGIAAVPAQPNK